MMALTELPSRGASQSEASKDAWRRSNRNGDISSASIIRSPVRLFLQQPPDHEAFDRPTAVIRVVRHPGPLSHHPRGAVLTMGNFDGLHKGHALLIGQIRNLAETTGRPTAVLTFEPHPRSVFLPAGEPFRLTPFRVKERELAKHGVDLLFVQHFDLGFAAKSAEDFIGEIIVGAIGASHLVVGWDCTFGNRRRGDVDTLRQAGPRHGFGVTVVEPIRGADATIYSSTQIREFLKAGRPRVAAALLGRFWEIDGRVQTGDRRGRTIGFPTANLGLGDFLRPAFGVYAVRVSGDGPDDPLFGRTVDGVANLGLRPTVGGLEPRLEAHLFDTATDLYGRHLRVALVEFIRPEMKFAGLDALRSQIAKDAAQARAILAAEPVSA
jgi:riboflavin kinase / FMN adenylyltransferase